MLRFPVRSPYDILCHIEISVKFQGFSGNYVHSGGLAESWLLTNICLEYKPTQHLKEIVEHLHNKINRLI